GTTPLPMTLTTPSLPTSPTSATTLLVPTSSATRTASICTAPLPVISPDSSALRLGACVHGTRRPGRRALVSIVRDADSSWWLCARARRRLWSHRAVHLG